jgi:lipoprotein-releasing system permease protein
MTSVVHVPALVRIPVRGKYHTRQLNLIGIDRETYVKVSDFSQFLLHPENQKKLSFLLREDGYAPGRKDFPPAGKRYRRERVEFEEQLKEEYQRANGLHAPKTSEGLAGGVSSGAAIPKNPFKQVEENVFDPKTEQHPGIVMGIAVCSLRARNADSEVHDYYLCQPGDDVEVIFPNVGDSPRPVSSYFTVIDLYESKMSEYDSGFAFVPLDVLQDLRGMIDPMSGVSAVTSIQIKLKPGSDLAAVRDELRARFPADQGYPYRIQTWRDLQSPLLSAVQLETTILNILLFMIIAVAGFGILATFFMIVVEKTRDIGVLKALGAPSRGVMNIFLAYGLSLGAVGSGVGMILGLLFVVNINHIAAGIEVVTGRKVFDETVYYFQEIPTRIDPLTIGWVVLGAVLIAVLASVLPALRAARLHPVEALRWE